MRKAVLASLVLLIAVPLLAQQPPHQPPPQAVLKQVLQFTDAQIVAFGSLEDSRRQAIEPVAKQLPDAQRAVETAINATSPDPCAVGAAVLRVHGLQQQIEQAQKTFTEGFNALLTDAQRTQLEHIHGVEAALHAAEALHAIGL